MFMFMLMMMLYLIFIKSLIMFGVILIIKFEYISKL